MTEEPAVTDQLQPGGPRPANTGRVRAAGLGLAAALVVALAALSGWGCWANHRAVARDDLNQQYVDAASQTVINMFTYNQNNISESVHRFINGTSGPLHDMMSKPGNPENLMALEKATQASSEAVITGAALEKIDDIAGNAAVLVAARITMADMNGVNQPSKAYRLRVIVHRDDDGQMTGYDLKYPDGGN